MSLILNNWRDSWFHTCGGAKSCLTGVLVTIVLLLAEPGAEPVSVTYNGAIKKITDVHFGYQIKVHPSHES